MVNGRTREHGLRPQHLDHLRESPQGGYGAALRTIGNDVGRASRRARTERGESTLRDAGIRSEGRYSPSAIAGYERAEPSVSLQRFCELTFYGVEPERLLSEILHPGDPEPVIDVPPLRSHVPQADGNGLLAAPRSVGGLDGNAVRYPSERPGPTIANPFTLRSSVGARMRSETERW